ncbi:MAG: 30S ribosomal protein S15 [Phycisphaerales bacterium JB039]
MASAVIDRSETVAQFRTHEKDTGSPQVQIALLTERIKALSEHLRTHRQDIHSRRGLILMVGKRNRLLRYLARTDRDAYLDTIQRLGLRK